MAFTSDDVSTITSAVDGIADQLVNLRTRSPPTPSSRTTSIAPPSVARHCSRSTASTWSVTATASRRASRHGWAAARRTWSSARSTTHCPGVGHACGHNIIASSAPRRRHGAGAAGGRRRHAAHRPRHPRRGGRRGQGRADRRGGVRRRRRRADDAPDAVRRVRADQPGDRGVEGRLHRQGVARVRCAAPGPQCTGRRGRRVHQHRACSVSTSSSGSRCTA